jgi:Tn3 transposase DDE domain
MDRAVQASAGNGLGIDPGLLKYLSPLGWEHINLTGDYHWKSKRPTQSSFHHSEGRPILSVLHCPFSGGIANRNSNRYEITPQRNVARQLNDNRKTNNP